MIIDWLNRNVIGFSGLSTEDHDAILGFSLLWSLFESSAMNRDANASKIVRIVDAWSRNGGLNADIYDEALDYFRKRYFINGNFSSNFDDLKLRPHDKPQLVRGVIKGSKNSANDRAATVLLVIWRLRNNLFHGEKWAYSIHDQLDNFNHANNVLMKIFETHPELLYPGRRAVTNADETPSLC